MRPLWICLIFAATGSCLASCGQVVEGSLPDWIPPAGTSANPLVGRWYSFCFPWIVATHGGSPTRQWVPWDVFGDHSLIQVRQVGPTSFLFEYFPGSPGVPDDWDHPLHRWFADGNGQQIDLLVPQPSSNRAPEYQMTLVSGSVRPDPRGIAAVWVVRYRHERTTLADRGEDVEFTCHATREDLR